MSNNQKDTLIDESISKLILTIKFKYWHKLRTRIKTILDLRSNSHRHVRNSYNCYRARVLDFISIKKLLNVMQSIPIDKLQLAQTNHYQISNQLFKQILFYDTLLVIESAF